MPSKNSLKTLIEGRCFHVYNRGVAKQNIFLREKDYVVFLRFLKEYLLSPNHPDLRQLERLNPRRTPKNCFGDVELLAYCLMPNHFHLLLKNITERGIEKFMRVLGTSYSLYFNKTYERVGPLYQGVYKAVFLESDEQFVYVSKYIHANPLKFLAKLQRTLLCKNILIQATRIIWGKEIKIGFNRTKSSLFSLPLFHVFPINPLWKKKKHTTRILNLCYTIFWNSKEKKYKGESFVVPL